MVEYGGLQSYAITPDTGWHVADVLVDGASVGAVTSYDFTDVAADHAIEASFAISFYFAEGYTGEGFQEYLCLGQQDGEPLPVRVTYLFAGDAPVEKVYDVPARSRLTIDVNSEVGAGREVSIRCEANRSFVAERPMYFDFKDGWTGGHDSVGANLPSNTWYFAEGYTGPGFEEWVCVLNDGEIPADLTFRFQTQEAGELAKEGLAVPAHSRRSFNVNEMLGGEYQNSLKIESTLPVVAERPMYFEYQGMESRGWTGGHCVMGAPSLSCDYYFAEGTTRAGFEEWLTIQNPDSQPISVSATYLMGDGGVVEKEYVVGAGRRHTVFVPDETGMEQDVSVHLSSTAGFLAERPMYFEYQGMESWGWTGGHCVIGATGSAGGWFFAEGYTGAGFEEWLCIQNPGDFEAVVTVTYYPEGGAAPFDTSHRVAAHSRYTVMVNGDAGPDRAMSAMVTSDHPVIVERPMYFVYNGEWDGGHDVMGRPCASP